MPAANFTAIACSWDERLTEELFTEMGKEMIKKGSDVLLAPGMNIHRKSLKVKDGCTLLRIHLETGRTHQIRVHFKSLGAPLVGDDMYGSTDKRLSHQALHCCFVRFTHPVTEKIMEFTAPMPDDMNKLT